MAVVTLKHLLKNEYFQTALMIILAIIGVSGFWFGSQLVLNTQHPALAVVSTSMLPTLNVGDVIIVQGLPAAEINADPATGDVVVYRSPSDSEKRIVHRAISKELRGNGYWLTTKGDNNAGSDPPFHESHLVGKVVTRIPYVGNFDLFVNALGNLYFFIILMIIVVFVLLSIPSKSTGEDEKNVKEGQQTQRLFGKLNVDKLYFLILNVFLIGVVFFALFGVFTFWQPGADPPQNVTIYGMLSDLQYHENFAASVSKAVLSQGFFTYKIDCLVNGSIRLGVPTLSWMQASILVLLIFNIWMLIKYARSRKLFARF